MGAENDTLDSWGLKETLELSNTGGMPHFAQGLCFNLTNPLPGDLELPAHFLQRSAISIDHVCSDPPVRVKVPCFDLPVRAEVPYSGPPVARAERRRSAGPSVGAIAVAAAPAR